MGEQNKTVELLPCPFCGGAPEIIDERVGYFVRCDHCKPFATVIYGESVRHLDYIECVSESAKAFAEVDWGALRQSAIDVWNRRTAAPTRSQRGRLFAMQLGEESRRAFAQPAAPAQPPAKAVREGLTDAEMFDIIRGTGCVTRGQAWEIAELLRAAIE